MEAITPLALSAPDVVSRPRKKRPTLIQRIRAKFGAWRLARTMDRTGVEVAGRQWRQAGLPIFSRDESARITIGAGCAWGENARLTARGSAVLEIGSGGYLNGCQITANVGVLIGAHCKIAAGAVIDDGTYHAVSPDRPCRDAAISIGRNVWINPGARIGPGVTIGDHSAIGAGAVVTRDIPARSFAAGVPARVVSTFECADDWVRG
jgi:acetyltransferase-like isoleucine patch superfamily enzyme